MNLSKIPVRYSKALISLAKEKNALEEVRADMDLIAFVAKTKELKSLLNNPVIKPSEKLQKTKNTFKDKIHPISMSLLELLLKNKRELYLESVCQRFMGDYDKEKGLKPAVLTTAKPLKTELKEKIIKLVEDTCQCGVNLEEQVKEEIIGGFILKVEDQQYDASVHTRLKNFRKSLVEKTALDIEE
jgi:F-type H+-transporting ATPase subunit delta